MLRWIILSATHGLMLVIGFAGGIYLLPILIAPAGPDEANWSNCAIGDLRADIRVILRRDFLHGARERSAFRNQDHSPGRLAPGPIQALFDCRFVEDEEQFLALKDTAHC